MSNIEQTKNNVFLRR